METRQIGHVAHFHHWKTEEGEYLISNNFFQHLNSLHFTYIIF